MKRLTLALLAGALLSGCAYRPVDHPLTLLGHEIPAGAAEKTIVLTPQTSAVNVVGGDTVRFVLGEREFGWSFDVGTVVRSFDLARVAPPGMLRQPVIAYVSPDPRYIGGGGADRSD